MDWGFKLWQTTWKLQQTHEGEGVHSTRRRSTRHPGDRAGNATRRACSERLRLFTRFSKLLWFFGAFFVSPWVFVFKISLLLSAPPLPFRPCFSWCCRSTRSSSAGGTASCGLPRSPAGRCLCASRAARRHRERSRRSARPPRPQPRPAPALGGAALAPLCWQER